MKTIILSVRPEWAIAILQGQKTCEIRKSLPKDLPCEVLIYVTKRKPYLRENPFCLTEKFFQLTEDSFHARNGKIMAKFTLNKVEKLDIPYPAYFHEVADKYKHIVDGSLVNLHEMHRYLGTKMGYAWHIDDLQVFDEPKLLKDFGLKRSPQSWAYAKEARP